MCCGFFSLFPHWEHTVVSEVRWHWHPVRCLSRQILGVQWGRFETNEFGTRRARFLPLFLSGAVPPVPGGSVLRPAPEMLGTLASVLSPWRWWVEKTHGPRIKVKGMPKEVKSWGCCLWRACFWGMYNLADVHIVVNWLDATEQSGI